MSKKLQDIIARYQVLLANEQLRSISAEVENEELRTELDSCKNELIVVREELDRANSELENFSENYTSPETIEP